jgi:adenine C2-methylase RlmN of 23S rRNA A2503 and tRNA A37
MFMGMDEPLASYNAVVATVRRISEPSVPLAVSLTR